MPSSQSGRIGKIGWSRRTEKAGYPFSYGYATSKAHRRLPGDTFTFCGIDLEQTEALNFIEGERAEALEECKRCANADVRVVAL